MPRLKLDLEHDLKLHGGQIVRGDPCWCAIGISVFDKALHIFIKVVAEADRGHGVLVLSVISLIAFQAQ